MKSVSGSFVPLAILLLLTVAATKPVKGFDCEMAKKVFLAPCIPFITTDVKTPPTACCNAVSNLKASRSLKPECRAVCDCLVGIPNLKKDKVIELPKLCNVDIGYTFPKDLDCTK